MQKVVKHTGKTIEHLDAPAQQPQLAPTQQPQLAPGGQQAQQPQLAQQAPVYVVSVTPSVSSNPPPSVFRLAPSGPVICPVGSGSGSGISQLCNCPPNTFIQSSFVNKSITYWCKEIE